MDKYRRDSSIDSSEVAQTMRRSLRQGLMFIGLAASLAVTTAATAATAVPSAAVSDGPVTLLTELKFDSPTLSAPGWTFGSKVGGVISVQSTAGPDPSGATIYALEGSYPAPGMTGGGQYIWADYSVAALHTEDLYIEFWAKMPGVKEGCKFLKVFGSRSGLGVADTGTGPSYAGGDLGSIRQIAFGDGTTLLNDSQNVINLNGAYPNEIGRSYGSASVQTPQMSDFPSAAWGTGWHHFRVHIKFNSGTSVQNEVPDGAYYLEIDGKVYANATGLFNRNSANGPIDYVEFFGWAQTEPQPFQLYYADIRISTGGFVTSPVPMPPTAVQIN